MMAAVGINLRAEKERRDIHTFIPGMPGVPSFPSIPGRP